jgi:hypothetical protein
MWKHIYIALFLISFGATSVQAERSGDWVSGYGQGLIEYSTDIGDSSFRLFDGSASGFLDKVSFHVSVQGTEPKPKSIVTIHIGNRTFEFPIDKDGDANTNCKICALEWDGLWNAIRAGQAMTVRLQTGQSAQFSLKGSGKLLGPEPFIADFYRDVPVEFE